MRAVGLGCRVHYLDNRERLALLGKGKAPPQPAVFVFGDELSAAHLEIALVAEPLEHDAAHLEVPLGVDVLGGQSVRSLDRRLRDTDAVPESVARTVGPRDGRAICAVQRAVQNREFGARNRDNLVLHHPAEAETPFIGVDEGKTGIEPS